MNISFQYPQSDRLRFNLCHELIRRVFTVFQYPQSDRLRFNGVLVALSENTNTFQYPQSDRLRFNEHIEPPKPVSDPPFSIRNRIDFASTIDHAVQPVANAPFSIRNRIDFASTLTTRRYVTVTCSFSIRNRIDFASTIRLNARCPPLPAFQYPQSDRLRFNPDTRIA